jgi:hypothetical protein
MEDLSALAARIATSAGALRGCLILSRDGLVLGAHPPEGEAALKPSWLRFATLGESDKGFVEFGDELWAYARRGAYGAFAVAEVSVRPGLLLDQLEQALLVADQDRTDKRDSLRIPDAPTAPSGKPRTNLHKEARPAPEQAPADQRISAPTAASAAPPPGPQGVRPEAAGPTASSGAGEGPVSPTQGAASTNASGPAPPPTSESGGAPEIPTSAQDPRAGDGREEEGEVDRVLLAQEFSRLLQEPDVDDEA